MLDKRICYNYYDYDDAVNKAKHILEDEDFRNEILKENYEKTNKFSISFIANEWGGFTPFKDKIEEVYKNDILKLGDKIYG